MTQEQQEHRQHGADYAYADTCAICRFEHEQARDAARNAKLDALLAGSRETPASVDPNLCRRCGTYCDGDCAAR